GPARFRPGACRYQLACSPRCRRFAPLDGLPTRFQEGCRAIEVAYRPRGPNQPAVRNGPDARFARSDSFRAAAIATQGRTRNAGRLGPRDLSAETGPRYGP